MIKVYIYSKSSKLLLFSDMGVTDDVMRGLKETEDFTLTPPPDFDHIWRWIDDKWITDNTAE